MASEIPKPNYPTQKDIKVIEPTEGQVLAVSFDDAPDWAFFYAVGVNYITLAPIAVWSDGEGRHEPAPVLFDLPQDMATFERIYVGREQCKATHLAHARARADREALKQAQAPTPTMHNDDAKAPTDDERRPGENPMVDKVSGYRKLSDEELAMVNRVKAVGGELADLVFDVRALIDRRTRQFGTPDSEHHRWASIGKTDLQTGLMALIRAVAAPEGF